jgi:hypothetical protein
MHKDGGIFLRGRRIARSFESGCLQHVPFYEGIGVRQSRATRRGEQSKRRRGSNHARELPLSARNKARRLITGGKCDDCAVAERAYP